MGEWGRFPTRLVSCAHTNANHTFPLPSLPPSLPPSFLPGSGKFPASSENKHRPSYGTNGKGEGGKEEGRKQRVVQSVEAGDLALQV